VDVGSFKSCQGGFPGLFDMAGNIAEITNSCRPNGKCYWAGGSYIHGPGTASCDGLYLTGGTKIANVGFRCCK
jgi:hypothetical protein